MFALLGYLDGEEIVSLKCDPERSAMLRLSFPAITAGYHLHKDHWNTIRLDGSVPAGLLRELIDHAYDVVAARAKPKPRTRRVSRRRARR
jgi:predicted DNA-binding protein (MmcQ/YjbR family)